MSSFFTSIEDIITDENFLSWYLNNDDARSKSWQEWLSQHSDDQYLVQQAVDFLNTIPIKEETISDTRIDAALVKLEASLNQGKLVAMKPRNKWWIPASAAAVALLFVGFVFLKTTSKKTILATNYGTIGAYKLPDGSEVILNAHSAVTLGKEWTVGKDREIWLKGEAFFKIQKTSTHDKFVVHASAMDIEVTGTQFNVVDRQDESSVLLTEGSVTIHSSTGKEIHMKPGDFVKIDNDNLEKKPVNKEKILAWKQSKLLFDHTSMQEVASIITRYYNVKVKFADSAIAKKQIGGVMSNDNLDLLIESLEALGEFKIIKTDKEIIISRPL
ncbi:MAG: FecR domain-containing protein [Chitinophagaceae bacterium]|nr:FecR domain-containing protein [Chitinophagaceae bacterium]